MKGLKGEGKQACWAGEKEVVQPGRDLGDMKGCPGLTKCRRAFPSVCRFYYRALIFLSRLPSGMTLLWAFSRSKCAASP